MVSKGFRFPTIREMYMFPPQNPDLLRTRMRMVIEAQSGIERQPVRQALAEIDIAGRFGNPELLLQLGTT